MCGTLTSGASGTSGTLTSGGRVFDENAKKCERLFDEKAKEYERVFDGKAKRPPVVPRLHSEAFRLVRRLLYSKHFFRIFF